jgi:MoxR-vWA-beta-propeller ternary system domain bpX4
MFFLKMIQTLRQQEEIMLYGNILNISEREAVEVTAFLNHEYQQESLSYPYIAPFFDENAALWGAKTVYIAAQLILYRENSEADLATLLPNFPQNPTAAALLSADLCLRFLPSMIVQLKLIDPEDELVAVLENLLHHWHYSAVNYPLDMGKCDFTHISENQCVLQL